MTSLETQLELNPYVATSIAEGLEEASEADQIRAWQYLHDTRLAYQLQGFFGRECNRLIEAGVITA